MIATKITTQSFIYRSTWSEAMEEIKKYWDEDYRITDFDFGDGMYRILVSKGTGWSGQAIRSGNEFPSDKVKELWDKSYNITNVTFDGKDWIVIMSQNTIINGQRWFTRSKFEDFKAELEKAWAEGYDITKVAFANGLYLGIMSKGLDWSQTWYHWPQFPTDELLEKKKTENKILTDLFAFDDMIFSIASSNTGFQKQRIHKNKDFEVLRRLLKNRWDDGYNITTVGFFKGEWVLIFSK